jgi:hypothetical protein
MCDLVWHHWQRLVQCIQSWGLLPQFRQMVGLGWGVSVECGGSVVGSVVALLVPLGGEWWASLSDLSDAAMCGGRGILMMVGIS